MNSFAGGIIVQLSITIELVCKQNYSLKAAIVTRDLQGTRFKILN